MARLDPLRPISLEWLIDRTATVYTLPVFYNRLSDTINHPRSSLTDIVKVITEDQGLTARILKLANSPLFGYFSNTDSITKAVTILGTRQLRDLALAVSVIEVFNGIPEELINMKSFWKHSIACGIISRELATFLRERHIERYFTAGILHDVGRVLMCTSIPDIVRDILCVARNEGRLRFDAEVSRLGFSHADAGGALLSKWKIPTSIAEPVACHHDPGSAMQFPREAAILHVADIICRALELGSDSGWNVPPLDDGAWGLLNIPAASLDIIIKQVEPRLEEAFAILGDAA